MVRLTVRRGLMRYHTECRCARPRRARRWRRPRCRLYSPGIRMRARVRELVVGRQRLSGAAGQREAGRRSGTGAVRRRPRCSTSARRRRRTRTRARMYLSLARPTRWSATRLAPVYTAVTRHRALRLFMSSTATRPLVAGRWTYQTVCCPCSGSPACRVASVDRASGRSSVALTIGAAAANASLAGGAARCRWDGRERPCGHRERAQRLAAHCNCSLWFWRRRRRRHRATVISGGGRARVRPIGVNRVTLRAADACVLTGQGVRRLRTEGEGPAAAGDAG